MATSKATARATWAFFRELEPAVQDRMAMDGSTLEEAYIAAIAARFSAEAPGVAAVHTRPSGDRVCMICGKTVPKDQKVSVPRP